VSFHDWTNNISWANVTGLNFKINTFNFFLPKLKYINSQINKNEIGQKSIAKVKCNWSKF
jgi:hypothetical protein